MDGQENPYFKIKDNWLAANMVYLTEDPDCGLGITASEREDGVFSVDVFCEDGAGNSFIQKYGEDSSKWETTLAHLLNYSVGASAKTFIWLSPNPGKHHARMVKWLDAQTPEDVRWYLFKIEAMKVGNAPPIPLFTMIFSPSQETICSEKEELAEKYRKRVKFWEGLLTVLNERMQVYQTINIPKDNQEPGLTGSYYQMMVWIDGGFVRMAKIF